MNKVEQRLLQAVGRLVSFPNAQVCKHWAACEILCSMEDLGFDLPEGLVAAVVDSRDEDTTRIIKASIRKGSA